MSTTTPAAAEATASHWIVRVVRTHSVVVVGRLISVTRARTAVATAAALPDGAGPPAEAGASSAVVPPVARSAARLRTMTVPSRAQPTAREPRTIVVAKKWSGTTGVFHAGTVVRE